MADIVILKAFRGAANDNDDPGIYNHINFTEDELDRLVSVIAPYECEGVVGDFCLRPGLQTSSFVVTKFRQVDNIPRGPYLINATKTIEPGRPPLYRFMNPDNNRFVEVFAFDELLSAIRSFMRSHCGRKGSPSLTLVRT